MSKLKIDRENFHKLSKVDQQKLLAFAKSRNSHHNLKIVSAHEIKNYKSFKVNSSIEGNPAMEEVAKEWEKMGLKRIKSDR